MSVNLRSTIHQFVANFSVNCYVSDTAVDREMRTGKHTVRDVYCGVCDVILGWRYVSRVDSAAVLHWLGIEARRVRDEQGPQQTQLCILERDLADLQDYAFEPEQKYKEGKFILECELITERPEAKARDPVFRPRIEEIVRDSTRPETTLAQQIPILNRG